MRPILRYWKTSGTPSPSVSPFAAAGAAAAIGLLSMGCDGARADEVCGSPADAQYVAKIATGMQQFAPKVTKTGGFAIKEDYPGNGTAVLTISFVDRGKTLFVHRVADYKSASATVMRAGKTKGGDPGFSVALVQGKLGACVFNVFVRDAKFAVVSLGLK
jgi:hypothetical protein